MNIFEYRASERIPGKVPWYKFPCHPGTPTEKPSMASVLGATVADLADMADFLDVLRMQGEHSSVAEKAVAGLLYFRPRLSRDMLPRTRRALRGYRKVRPPMSRLPLVDDLVCGLVVTLIHLGHPLSALAVFVASKCCLRPGEIVSLQASDASMPIPGHQGNLSLVTLTVAPAERAQMSKTQTFDDAVLVDDPVWLGELIVKQARY